MLTAWQFSTFVDLLRVDDVSLAAVPEDAQWPAAPMLVTSDTGDGALWIVDGPFRREVPDDVVPAWRFAVESAVVTPAAQLDAMPRGPDLRVRPFMVQGTQPAVYLLDEPPCDPMGCDEQTDTSGGIGDTGEGGASGDEFEIFESELEGTDANIVLEALDRIYASGDFAGDAVVLLPGRSLTLRTTRTDASDAPADLGIDLVSETAEQEALEWRVSEGATITLETRLAAPEIPEADDPKASIVAGRLVADGAAFTADARFTRDGDPVMVPTLTSPWRPTVA